MRYIKYLQQNKYIPYEDKYINYETLKKLLSKNFNDQQELYFVEQYDKEFLRVFTFVEKKYDSMCAKVNFMENLQELTESQDNEIKNIINEMYSFAEFIRVNIEGFKRILKKHDHLTKYELYKKYIKEIKSRIKKVEDLNRLIYRISRLKLKRTEVKKETESNKSFIRKTNKYWVHTENLIALKTKILKHLPIYVFSDAKESETPFSGWNHETHDTCVSSVYFDNTSFELYHGRIKKNQGAEAIRLRWYGSSEPEIVFVERKRHEDSWTGDKSKKLRFKIHEKYVLDFINGKDIWNHVERENGKEVFDLYKSIQSTIINKKLRPMVRTFYKRSAFQLPNDSSVRISIDSNLVMIKECTDEEIITNPFPLKRWRRKDVNCEWPFENLDKKNIVRFPHAILEIKTQGLDERKPKWIEDLISSSYVEHVHKFSKFMHGCAMLFDNIDIIPYWLPQVDTDIRKDPYHFKKQANRIFNGKVLKIPGESEHTTSEGLSPVSDHGKKIAIPVRVEPKVFFANERTFLKWIQFAIFLGGVGTAMLGLGDYESSLCGFMLIIVAIMFSFYGLYLYYWRNKMIHARDLGPYDDLNGPTLLIIMFLAAMFISVIFKIPIKKKKLI